MTDYRAQPEDWATQKKWLDDCEDARCLLELRARVEALETMRETEKAAVLDLYEQHDKLKEWVGKNYMRIRALEDGATCPHIVSSDEGTSYCALAEQTANSKPTPNPSQIRSSLVERVSAAIVRVDEGHDWTCAETIATDEARAAIREVAAALRAQCFEHAADCLEQEAER